MNSNIPSSFLCPITGDIMRDPVLDREGNSYERAAILEWLSRNNTSPITRSPLYARDIFPNRGLKQLIEDFLANGNLEMPQSTQTTTHSTIPTSTIPPLPERTSSINASMDISPWNIDSTDGLDHYLVHGALSCTAEGRVPADIVVVIDVSGSMNDPVKNNNNEVSGLTILDIVKHAVRTINEVMNENDRLAIVKFSDAASVCMPLTTMNERGKLEVTRTLQHLLPQGSTNIWDGLKCGMDVLKIANGNETRCNNSFVILLTDGAPNIEPPRGNLPMLARYKESNGGKLPGTICTFGFGYSLDSNLLRDLACFGGGMYSFIPDAGLVGTVFINALSNVLCTATREVSITLNTMNGAVIVPELTLNDSSHVSTPTGVTFYRSDIQAGQSFDFVKHIAVPRGTMDSVLSMDVTYFACKQLISDGPKIASATVSTQNASSNNWELHANYWRLHVVSLLNEIHKLYKKDTLINQSKGLEKIQATIREMNLWMSANSGCDSNILTRLSDLLTDVEGQVYSACARIDYYEKWGRHYLPSLARSHELQQANNFKDPGIQHYGGPLFNNIRDLADELFTTIPAPIPRHQVSDSRSTYGASYGHGTFSPAADPLFSMATFHSRDAGCVHGDCLVELYNGDVVPARSLVRGSRLRDGSIIMAVMKTLCLNNTADLVHFENGLKITAYHPIMHNGKWTFPCDIAAPIETTCDSLYSFVVYSESGIISKSVPVNGIDCITLGHGIQDDPVASHPFFGTDQVIMSLQSARDWRCADGVVTLNQASHQGTMIRDSVTSLVCGLVFWEEGNEVQPELDGNNLLEFISAN